MTMSMHKHAPCLCYQNVIFLIVKCLSFDTFHEKADSHTLPLHSVPLSPLSQIPNLDRTQLLKKVWRQTLKAASDSAVILEIRTSASLI